MVSEFSGMVEQWFYHVPKMVLAWFRLPIDQTHDIYTLTVIKDDLDVVRMFHIGFQHDPDWSRKGQDCPSMDQN